MVTVPAIVWRFAPLLRGVILGVAAGFFFGALAWLDSEFLVTGLIVFVMLCVVYGVWMSRRMARHWPAARLLTGPQREQVARAAREGVHIDDPALAPALTDYRNGLHEAAEETRILRWLVWFVLVVAVGMAVWDAAFGSWGNAIVSVIYLVLLILEVFWWPKRQRQLLANADRAATSSGGRAPG